MTDKCKYCGALDHPGVCHMIKAIEYHPDGTIKRVDLKCAADYLASPISVPSIPAPSLPPQTQCGPAVSYGAEFGSMYGAGSS